MIELLCFYCGGVVSMLFASFKIVREEKEMRPHTIEFVMFTSILWPLMGPVMLVGQLDREDHE